MSGTLLYLHGFTSAPQSKKAQALKARIETCGSDIEFICPQLPYSPRSAIALAEDIIAASRGPVTLVGSSLGGYYATWLLQHHADVVGHAVLVNPAVVAHLSLQQFIGPQQNLYTGERFDFTAAHVDELRAIEVAELAHPERIWLLVEQGDELLDYRHALARYRGARQTAFAGGDHSFTRWDEVLDAVITYAGDDD